MLALEVLMFAILLEEEFVLNVSMILNALALLLLGATIMFVSHVMKIVNVIWVQLESVII